MRGGPSPEYDVSLATGGAILANLPEECEPLDIFISQDGVWHTRGVSRNPSEILKTVDVAINALHGAYGEDGTVQRILNDLRVPYTGSDHIASALGMNKRLSKHVLSQAGLKTPHHIVIRGDHGITRALISEINENLIFPIIIKPVNSGSSLGVSLARRASEIRGALEESLRHSPELLVEEFINGKEATCGVIEGWRGRDFYSLVPVEIERSEKLFHDYDSKYVKPSSGLGSRYRVPGNFTSEEKRQIEKAAALVHKTLGLRHYSRSDFILHPRRGLFFLEVNTLPELTHRSSFVKSLEALGGSLRDFLSHLIFKVSKK